MLNQSSQPTRGRAPTQAVERFDLVVIGAGIAGLNALNAASEYLPQGARVMLLDQKEAPGGMWNTAYDYVRLHQPHPMFTVGNLKWDWQKPRDYLAARDEVQTHLSRALGPIADTVDLQTRYGMNVTECREVGAASGARAEITYHPNGAPDDTCRVEATRAIYASGLNYRIAQPLALSSETVISIIPQELQATLVARPGAPVVVVGGGKTGMDTVLAVLAADPSRRVSLIKGRGTNFINRTKYVPTGFRRWTSGALVSRLFRDLALTFDGDNEDKVLAHLRQAHSTDPDGQNGVFLYGLQSEEEHAKICAGVSETYADYLVDVADIDGCPQMHLRSGNVVDLRPGSVVVNCSGSFFRNADLEEPMPLLSRNGAILTINPRDAFHFLTSVAGFFGTHLWYRDQLRGQGFYCLDHEALFRQNRNAWVGASAAQAYLNQVVAVQTLPMMLLDRCGLDLDRWYPLPRRMAGLIAMKSTARRDIAHCQRVLDRVAARFDIRAEALD